MNFSFKKNIIIIVIAGVLALGVGGTVIGVSVYNSPANQVSRYLNTAERYLSEMNYEQAVIEFQKILEIEPMNVDAYLGLADAYIGMGDIEKAVEILREGLEKTGDSMINNKIDGLTKPVEPAVSSSSSISSSSSSSSFSSSSSSSSESSTENEPVESLPEYGSMGFATIAGVEFDIATTTEIITQHQRFNNDDVKQMGKLKYLKILNIMNGNQISDITPLAGLKYLTSLELYGNQISDITPVAGLTNLTVLDFRNNKVSDVSALAGLTNLENLQLSDNQISDVSPLAGLKNLKYLNLDGNPISDADKEWLKEQLLGCDINY